MDGGGLEVGGRAEIRRAVQTETLSEYSARWIVQRRVKGEPPATRGQSFQYSLRVQGRLVETQEFADVIVGSKPDGSFIRVRASAAQ